MGSYTIDKLSPAIGAEISGIDLLNNSSKKFINDIYNDLIRYKVIFFRNQYITPQFHLEFARKFGDLDKPHPIYPNVDNFSEIVLLENDKQHPPDTDIWHTDVTYKTNPPFASILYSKIISSEGGDTLWSSLTSIYDDLPSEMKKYLSKLRAIHDMGDFRNDYINDDNNQSSENLNNGFNEFGNAVHDIIKTHPVSKKKLLYINPGFTRQIVGLHMNESNDLLNYLFNFMNKPEYQVRFKWTPNTLAIWDNRATMHYAVGDYMPKKRVMHRVTVLNDRREQK